MKRVLFGSGLLLLAGAGLFALSTIVGSRSALVVSPDRLAFGEIPAGESERRVVVVTNSSDETLAIQRIEASTPFDVARGSLSLGPRQSQPVMVTFAPADSGRVEGELVFESPGFDGGIRSVQLEGSAYRPAEISVDPLFLSFGEVRVGETGRASITIANGGEADLELGSLVTAAPFRAEVASATVASAATRSVEVYFEPSMARDYEKALRIRSNDPERSTVLVYLDGTGVDHAPTPRIQVSPSNLDFGAVPVGKSQTQRLSIRNSGDDPLTLTALQAPVGFSVPSRSRQIEPGEELSLPVSFSPGEGGTVGGALSIYSNDPYQRVIGVSLSGAGQERTVADSRGAGEVPVGVSNPSQPVAGGDPSTGTPSEAEVGPITTAEAGTESTAAPDGLDPDAGKPAPSSGLDGGELRVASYPETLSAIHVGEVSYDAASGALALNDFQLPTVDLPLGEWVEFESTAAIGRFDPLGEAEVVMPVTMYDFRGNPVEMTVNLTTGVSTAVVDQTLIAMIGRPLGADGRTTLVGLVEFPHRSPFYGHVMRLSLDVHVR